MIVLGWRSEMGNCENVAEVSIRGHGANLRGNLALMGYNLGIRRQ